jgi:hypothetical protein
LPEDDPTRHHDPDLQRIYRKLEYIADEDYLILQSLNQLINLLSPHLTQGKVQLDMKTIQVGGTSLATLALLDQNGSTMVIDSTYTVQYSASAPGDVSLAPPNQDGSATITGVNANPGVTIGAVVTRPDGVQVTLTPDTLVITAVTPPGQVLTSGAVVLT